MKRSRIPGDRLRGSERPFAALPARIAYQARAPADQRNRPMSGALKMQQPHYRNETSHVQTRRRRVEAAVRAHDPMAQPFRSSLGVLMQQSTPGELIQKVRRIRH